MIATRKGENKGGSIAGIIIFLIGALIGFAGAGSFSDLNVWSSICLILAGLNLCSAIFSKKDKMPDTAASVKE